MDGVNSSSGVPPCQCDSGDPVMGSGNLTREGNTIYTDKYEITVTHDTVVVKDRETGKTVTVWGDPHVWTGDGDKGDFYEDNFTIDLPDGTKVTITPTELKNGVSWVEQVDIMNGENAYSVTGVHTKPEPVFSELLNSADVDKAADDGTVVYPGDELDDLYLRATGEEFVGQGVLFDGLGGESAYDFTEIVKQIRKDASEAKMLGEIESELAEIDGNRFSGGDVYMRLFKIMQKIQDEFEKAVDELEDLQGIKEKQNLLDKKLTELKDEREKMVRQAKAEGGEDVSEDNLDLSEIDGQIAAVEAKLLEIPSNVEGRIETMSFKVQSIKQFREQVNQMMTNLARSDHDNKMAILRNLGR